MAPPTPSPKLLDLKSLVKLREQYRQEGKAVVWTNGCFDIFHAGHVGSLQAAKALGDILIVGLNSDRSVHQYKGPARPICPEQDRAAVLSAMESVDHVLLFDGVRCTPELSALLPDVYAQGEDYTIATIDQDERAAVEAGGGRIAFLPLVEGISTSLILKRIRRNDEEKIVSAAFALIRDGAGRLLLVANRYLEGIRWGLPGGGHVRGERLEDTVVRECQEEVGLTARVSRYRGVIERYEPATELHLILHLFEAETPEGEVPVVNPSENIMEAAYFDLDRLHAETAWILGRQLFIQYLQSPETFPYYSYMGPGEE